MKRILTWSIIWTVVIACGVGWYLRSRFDQLRAKQAAEQARIQFAQIDSQLADMAKANSATIGWEAALARSTDGKELYSLDVEQSVMPKDGRPILLVGSPKDVRSVAGKLLARFEGDANDLFYGDDFTFELECDEATANVIRANDSLTSFGIVALISSFKTTDSDVVVGGQTERHREFVSRGRCLSLLPLDIDYQIGRSEALRKQAGR